MNDLGFAQMQEMQKELQDKYLCFVTDYCR